jgi:hypothetical protein
MFGQVADAIGEDELAQALREAPLGAARMAKQLKAVAPQAWAEGMQQAFRNQKFVDFIEELLPDLLEIIGSRTMHGLAEAAINAGETRLFQ